MSDSVPTRDVAVIDAPRLGPGSPTGAAPASAAARGRVVSVVAAADQITAQFDVTVHIDQRAIVPVRELGLGVILRTVAGGGRHRAYLLGDIGSGLLLHRLRLDDHATALAVVARLAERLEQALADPLAGPLN